MTELVLTFVINAAIQSTIVAVVAIVVSRMLREWPARLRFALMAFSVVVAVAAPAISMLPQRSTLPAAAPATQAAEQPMTPSFAAAIVISPQNQSGAEAIATFYLIGLVAAGVRMASAWARTRRLIVSAVPFESNVRLSDAVGSPISIGVHILIPRTLIGSDLLPAALEHERAHVRRHDFAINALLEVIALPLYWHPAAMLLRRELAVLREIACDDEAAQQTSGQHYAAALVRLASLAAGRDAFAVGIAATPIERRIAALQRRVPPRRTALMLALTFALPLVLLLACSRVSVSPAFAPPNLCGVWKLLPEASDFRAMQPQRFDEFTQWIAQGPRQISVRQHRVANSRAEDHSWSVITDAQSRDIKGIPGARGSATWSEGKLALVMTGPGNHRESVVAFVRGDRLICEGTTERGHYRAVFQREN